MSRVIQKPCDRCGTDNAVDLDELVGQPLQNETGTIVQPKPVVLDNNPIWVQCESCRGPIPFVASDME